MMRTRLVWLFALAACSRVEYLADDRDASPATDASLDATRVFDGAEPEDAEPEAGGPITYDGGRAYCDKRLCQCSDGVDNDDDGFSDGRDPECTGASDDSEADFGTGARPEPDRNFTGCFFDDDQGLGVCKRPVSCFGSPQQDRPGNGAGGSGCGVSEQCENTCLPRVPNGCDCFGCCEVIVGAQKINVLLRAGCSMSTIYEAEDCAPCTPSSTCNNPCEECEFCPGRTELPARCGGNVECSQRNACPKGTECTGSEYCLQGCCFPIAM